jgi:hypothetical protein
MLVRCPPIIWDIVGYSGILLLWAPADESILYGGIYAGWFIIYSICNIFFDSHTYVCEIKNKDLIKLDIVGLSIINDRRINVIVGSSMDTYISSLADFNAVNTSIVDVIPLGYTPRPYIDDGLLNVDVYIYNGSNMYILNILRIIYITGITKKLFTIKYIIASYAINNEYEFI